MLAVSPMKSPVLGFSLVISRVPLHWKSRLHAAAARLRFARSKVARSIYLAIVAARQVKSGGSQHNGRPILWLCLELPAGQIKLGPRCGRGDAIPGKSAALGLCGGISGYHLSLTAYDLCPHARPP